MYQPLACALVSTRWRRSRHQARHPATGPRRPARERNGDSASDDFWAPIPKLKGPFFIRVGVYDAHGERLDYADTQRFR
jgi:hypothetical protein